MGTWGIKTFENDEALDWAADLEEIKDESLLKESLNPEEVEGYYLEAPECVRILCASEVIAGVAGNQRQSLPDNVLKWINNHRKINVAHLTPLSISKVKRVLAQHSELDELWAENEEDYPNWKEDVLGLCELLKSLPKQPEPTKNPWWRFW